MGKEGTVAPKERVNITYKAATGDAMEEMELPHKTLVLGDFTGRPDDRTVEDRKPINVDKDNFNEVMAEQDLALAINVRDELSEEQGQELGVQLKFESLKDFTPEGIANQVDELQKLMALRNALTALKGPMGNIPAFRKKIQALLGDDEGRTKLMAELGLDSEGKPQN